MRKTLKRVLAYLLCAVLLCSFAVVPQANAREVQTDGLREPASYGENVIYGVAGETAYVPAGYTYIYEDANGHVRTYRTERDTFVSTRVLNSQEAEALAGLEFGRESYTVDANGKTLVCKEFDAAEAAAYSDAVQAILNGAEVNEGDKISVLCEACAPQTPVRVLITFEDAPVIRMKGMSVALSNGLGEAELQAVQTIETRQLSVMAKAEKKLGYDIEINNQFTLLTNAVSATVNYGDLAVISKMDGVKSAILMPSYAVPEINARTVTEDFVLEPDMKYAGPGMGANQAWNVGYKGEGMSVAVIDTGLAYANPAFSIEPTDPDSVAYTRDDIANILATKDLHAETLAADTSIDTVYYSSKIPYGFNYGDGLANYGSDDDTWFGHGSHVAGIVAGNLPEEVKEEFRMDTLGIAPEAQLVIMKVFDQRGNCYFDYLIAAIEDAITLGVDCANLSLGMPSGPVYYEDVTEVYDAAVDAGINVVVSAGNDAHSGFNSLWGSNLVKSTSVSTGTLGMPGTFDSVLTVASAENSHDISFYGNAISWQDGKVGSVYIAYEELSDVPAGKGFKERLEGERFTFTDSLDDAEGKLVFYPFEGGNADGVIAAAAEAGAAGLVLTVPELSEENNWTLAEVTATRYDVPTCVSDKGQYEWMLMMSPPKGIVRVDALWNPSATAGQMSEFSSWGPTEGLTLKPEITGIGGNVFSAYYGEYFATASGTSMSSPAVAASAALLRQYLTENELVDQEELAHAVNCLLMSTATPVYDQEHGTCYFVRRQGAGLANIGAAIASNAYITVEGTNKAKLELGDDPQKTGVYGMAFQVVNFSDEAKTYALDTTVLGQKAEGGRIKNGQVTYLTFDYARNLSAAVTSNLENDIITVPAHSTAQIAVTVSLSELDKFYYDERFPAGAYVEGFVQLLSDETPNLTVPFLAFYGDFDAAPILEEGTYETTLGGSHSYVNADQFYSGLWSTEYGNDELGLMSNYSNTHYLGDSNHPIMVTIPWEDYVPNENGSWAKPFYPERAGISPNNDGNLDYLGFGLSLRRNADNIHYTVTNINTGEVLWEQDTGFMQKTYIPLAHAGSELSMDWLYPIVETEYGIGYDKTQCLLEENTWVEIRADVTPEGAAEATESKSFTFYVDSEGPVNNENVKLFVESYEPDLSLYTIETVIDEQWFLDYSISAESRYNEERDEWETFVMTVSYPNSAVPLNGQQEVEQSGFPEFGPDMKLMHFYYDYAGNVSAYEISGGENLLDYVDLKAEKTGIAVGDTLTITDVGEAPYSSILNWSVSDPTVAEIVETTDHTVTITGLSRGTVTVYGGLGEYMEEIEITVADPAYEELKTQFTDVQDHWAKDEIVEAVWRGLFKGMDEDTFAPNAKITRGQLVTALYRMEGEPEGAAKSGFQDVKEDKYYTDAVNWAAENGIVNGIKADVFAPNQAVTREQFATILYRYAEYKELDVSARADLSAYKDADKVSSYAEDAISWAVAEGLIKGVSGTTLSPKGTATRAQAAVLLIRFQDTFN